MTCQNARRISIGPAGFSPDDADLFARNEIFINAPCVTVWQHLVEAPKWPLWYSNSHDLHISNDRAGLLQQDSSFEFNTQRLARRTEDKDTSTTAEAAGAQLAAMATWGKSGGELR
jgi:hypothetical protein